MSLKLTKEQKEKLRKLDEEMKFRKETEEKTRTRREASSKATGIPVDIVDMDIIKIGTLLGLIKKKSILEGKEPNTTGSILNMFFGGGDDCKIDTTHIPKGFRNAPTTVTEADKIQYHQQYVQQQCKHLADITMSLIKQELSNINTCISLNIDNNTLDDFKTTCVELVDVILEEICTEEETENDQEIWVTLTTIRNSLLGVMDVCEYKNLLHNNILALRKAGKPYKNIISHLSVTDSRFSLYQGCLQKTQGPLPADDEIRLIRELELRSYLKPPELRPFDFEDIVKHCCVPSLLCAPLDVVVEHGLVGPYRNNPIGYLAPHPPSSPPPWAFYVLKAINADGVRLWVLDNKLLMFTDNMIATMTSYLIKIFRTFYGEYYGSNAFKQGFWMASHNKHYDAFLNMMRNLAFVSNKSVFHQFLIVVLRQKSPLIPTEYDFFNHVMHYNVSVQQPSFLTTFEENMHHVFDDLEAENMNKLKTIFCAKIS